MTIFRNTGATYEDPGVLDDCVIFESSMQGQKDGFQQR